MRSPARIVSLVPSTTESLCALGAGAALVGCTRYCEEPAGELAAVRRVGGTKNPQREAILALHPDLVLANAEENRAEDLEWLQARVRVVVHTPRTVGEAAACLRDLAAELAVPEAVQPFLLRIESQLAAAQVALLEAPAIDVFYPVWCRPWISINGDTFVHDVLRVVGLRNIAADLPRRYPEVELEWVRSRRPGAVLLPSEPWAFTASDRDVCRGERTFGPAAVELCDGRDFCWHGVRLADGLGRALRLAARLRRAAGRRHRS
ncbi:MAG: ABC transporter substrate-binding protein [Planctomycetes bacterium]|nr:ABC transporter substrate-binding protein [Planctomycetota bacterium]